VTWVGHTSLSSASIHGHVRPTCVWSGEIIIFQPGDHFHSRSTQGVLKLSCIPLCCDESRKAQSRVVLCICFMRTWRLHDPNFEQVFFR
jgi:hypothetical protein